jgi:putative endopeptidase
MRITFLVAASAAALLTACGRHAPAATAAAKPTLGAFGIDTVQMDAAMKPGDEFYKYVNGKWLEHFEMPADKARYGEFDRLRDKSEEDIRTVLEELAKKTPPAGSVSQKVADLYNGWMDEATINGRGIEALKGDLDMIEAARRKSEIVLLMGRFDYAGPVGLYITPDPADTTKYVVNVTQGGLGMPNRDYYEKTGQDFDRYRAAYKAYVANILQLIGDKSAVKSADAVYVLEKKIAHVQWTPEQQRDVRATNNPVDRAGLKKTIPAINWDAMLPVGGLGDVQHFVINETTALTEGAKLLDTVPVDTWKKYLAFHLASDYAAYLPTAFDEANFDFYSRTIRGIKQQRDRWKRGVNLLNQDIGEGVGELYVAKYFPPENKAKMDALVTNLRTAMGERLKTLSWMDDSTRAEAQKKLATFEPRIGYPVKWRDYSAMAIVPGKMFENIRAARKFEWDRQVGRLNQPVDRNEWNMNPQTVNAYYSSLMNQITFPAAILQPPFFDANADPAVNYGAIGAVIGHEMGHAYDDQGAEYDETGKIRNWWTPETASKFKAATQKLGAQYAAFCPLEGACIQPGRTMGENIGDLGGLEMAYTAYHLSLNGKEAPVLGGFTGDQRFFMAHAQVWRGAIRDDALRSQLLTDPHSPAAARATIPERNVDAWYTAFGVKEGDKLYLKPADRVHIW